MVLNIIISTRAVQYTLSHFNVYAAAGIYVQTGYLCCMALLMSHSAANLVAQERDVQLDVCQLAFRMGAADEETCNQVMLLQEEVASCKVSFTGWSCFNIDRPFILTVIGAIITYSIVLQQLT